MLLCRLTLRTPALRAGAGVAALSLLALGIATANPEAVVAKHFTAALETPRETVAGLTRDEALVSGSEAYWLAEKRRIGAGGAALEPAAWTGAPFAASVAVGDRITLSGAKGTRTLEVVTVTDAEEAQDTAGATGGHGVRKIAVTCRDIAAPNAPLVTFEAPAEMAAGVGKLARDL
ncbi:MAG: hypothetical protein AB7S70_13590 [Hyphomicrobium sp.]|uniref:hypothetical protein n=1 Tax=Hyphomicrobium sp. TaxID=82 RepID=UPI003D11E1C4